MAANGWTEVNDIPTWGQTDYSRTSRITGLKVGDLPESGEVERLQPHEIATETQGPFWPSRARLRVHDSRNAILCGMHDGRFKDR